MRDANRSTGPLDGRILDELRSLPASDEAFRERVMASLDRDVDPPSHVGHRRGGRAGLGLVASVAGLAAALVWSLGSWPVGPPMPSPSDGHRHWIRFAVTAPEAREVTLLGSFNDWDPIRTPMARSTASGASDEWEAWLELPSGRHEYAFRVDGRWLADDGAPSAPVDEYGVVNSVLVLTDDPVAP